ncbi:hypothetical protein PMI14_03037 [Acidovorax sp. CF316]|uniref:hypothetical protein n=1 Tax=Acidovorax sp. CF316 TaxID=1144317 RepID=UPI00026BCB50|nr:hypothetical protein [Acidovorax sp. CF316]EJE52234.1 hypothetical protein PMI14_03037 [Acidovorax sp. CF316]
MRDHRHPEGLAPALPAAYATSTATPGSTARATDAPPQRRRSREELAAAQQRAQSRVQGQVQKQKDQERRARMRQAQQRREQQPAARLFVPYKLAAGFVALLVFVFGGALFEVARGEHFLVTGHATLRAATPWLVLAAAPLWYWALCRTEVLAPWWVQQMPTWFVRQMVAYPFAALLGAAAVGAAPWGWAAYLGELVGKPARVEVRVVSVEAPRTSSSCTQYARLEFRGSTDRVCVNTSVTGVMPRAGDTVVVAGRVSRWGLHVGTVHAK